MYVMVNVAENNKRIAKNTLYMYIRMGITMLVQLYTSRVVLSSLGISDYGIYNVVGSVIVMFTFISGPLGTATQRFLNFELGKGEGNKLNVVFNLSFYSYILLGVILFLLIELSGLWYINHKMNLPSERADAAMFAFHLSLIAFVIQLVKTPFESLVIAYERMSYYAYISILEVVLKLGNAFSLLFIGIDKLKLYALNQLIISIIILLCLQIYCHRQFVSVYLTRVWDRTIFKSLLSFSGWSLVGSVATISANQGNNLLLNYFYGVTVNAAVGIAEQVSAAVNQFVSNFQIAYRPQIVKYYAVGDYMALRRLILNTSKYSFLLLFLLACPVMFNIHFLLKIWLGNVPEYAAEFVILNLVYMLLETLSAPMWMTVQATGKIKNYQLIISSCIFLNIVLSFLFLSLGALPLVVLEIKCGLDLIYLLIRLLFMKSKIQFPIKYFIRKVIAVILLIIIVPLAIMFLLKLFIHNDLVYLFASTFSFMVAYIPCLMYIGVDKDGRSKLFQYAKSRICR